MGSGYGELKRELLKCLEMIKSTALQRENRHLMEYLKEIKQKLKQGRFNLVVLGEFKRGKTTFLNALLGANLLPTAVVPLTSIVTLMEAFERVMDRVTDESKLYYVFGEQQTLLAPDSVRLSALFLPKFIAGPMILREMSKKVERELDRNCGRLRTDYTDRIYKSARKFKSLFEEKFDAAIGGTRQVLSRAIERRESSEKESAEACQKLEGQLHALKAVRTSLQKILA